METIRIGLEMTFERLRRELLSHPEKFFFILVLQGRAALCVSTCDASGEEIMEHEIDGLTPDSEGNLVSLLQGPLEDAVADQRDPSLEVREREEYPITPVLGEIIGAMPGLCEWVLGSVLSDDRNLVFYTR